MTTERKSVPMGSMTMWPSLITDLLESGLTRPELAERVGAGVSTINELARGATRDPRHTLGQRLLALHAERISKNTRRKGLRSGRKRAA